MPALMPMRWPYLRSSQVPPSRMPSTKASAAIALRIEKKSIVGQPIAAIRAGFLVNPSEMPVNGVVNARPAILRGP